jgi:hypothetical protein
MPYPASARKIRANGIADSTETIALKKIVNVVALLADKREDDLALLLRQEAAALQLLPKSPRGIPCHKLDQPLAITAFSTRPTSLYNPRAVSRSTGSSRSTSAGSRARSSAAGAPITLSKAEITPHHKYCYIHGHNLTHWGTACWDMAVAPEVYQNAIGAKKPSHTDPPGETHVQPLKGVAKPIQISGSFRSWPERPEQHWCPEASVDVETARAVSEDPSTAHSLDKYKVFSVCHNKRSIVFTPDSCGATHVLMRQCDSHILHTIYPLTETNAPGFEVANLHKILPISRGTLAIPNTTIDVPVYIFRDSDLSETSSALR